MHALTTAQEEFCANMHFIQQTIESIAERFESASRYYIHNDAADLIVWRSFAKELQELCAMIDAVSLDE